MVVEDQAMGFCRRSLALGGRRLPKILLISYLGVSLQELLNLIEGHGGTNCLLFCQKARYRCRCGWEAKGRAVGPIVLAPFFQAPTIGIAHNLALPRSGIERSAITTCGACWRRRRGWQQWFPLTASLAAAAVAAGNGYLTAGVDFQSLLARAALPCVGARLVAGVGRW